MNMTNEYVINDRKLTESVWNSFMLIKLVYHIVRQHKSKSKFFSLKVAIFTPLLKTINHCTALHCCHSKCCGGLLLKCAVVQVIAGVTRWKVIDVLVKHLWFAVYHIFCTHIYVTGYLENQTLCLMPEKNVKARSDMGLFLLHSRYI